MIVVGIETSTPQVSVAVGTERGVLGRIQVTGRARQEVVTPALERLLAWTRVDLAHVGGFAVGVGPGLFTGLRIGVETAKTLAQVTGAPIVGLVSLDVLAYAARLTPRAIVAAIDGRRGEVFWARYRQVPGGVLRDTPYAVARPEAVVAELEAEPDEVLLVGDGAMLYHDVFGELGARAEFASPVSAHPDAAHMVELAVPRFLREEHDRLFEVVPMYLRRSDAEIAWDERARGA
ncbi:MAG TPA: tRNA (adenosine(37)-N6)-threonylcarbamoyltransferase complex dimerization subunit type 1 TsaB [Actinomycetota bacterium]